MRREEMPLKTDYKNDVLDTSKNTKRKYQQTTNSDGTISLDDVTVYSQEGSLLGANDINATNTEVNRISGDLTASDGEPFRYAKQDGKRGYIVNEEGADTFYPFKGINADEIYNKTELAYGIGNTTIYTNQTGKWKFLLLKFSIEQRSTAYNFSYVYSSGTKIMERPGGSNEYLLGFILTEGQNCYINSQQNSRFKYLKAFVADSINDIVE